MTVVEKNIIDIRVMKSFTKHNQNLLIIFFPYPQLRRRRCLLEHECTDVIHYKLVKSNQTELPGECVDKCLAGYLESKDGRSCTKCADKCPKSRSL